MNTKLQQLWDEAESKPGQSIPVGDIVVCDFCNDDYTQSAATGGLILGSYAICEKCSPKVAGESNHVRACCPEGKSFADFVREYRGPTAAISITRFAAAGCLWTLSASASGATLAVTSRPPSLR